MKLKEEKTYLNLGSHNKRVEGYVNVDVQDLENVDIVHDLTKFPYPFDSNTIEEIFMEEFLEHISFRFTYSVLKECYRIIKPQGVISIQVPDIGTMCRMYANGEVCDCVPHKAATWEDFKSDPDCPLCHGKAKISTSRFWISFSGAGKHPWDWHHAHFDKYKLSEILTKVGFKQIELKANIYKLKIKAKKL